MVDIRPIKTDQDHRAAVEEIDRLWGAAEDTPEGDRLDILATLVDAYEDQRWPVADLDPVEAIEAAMAHEGRTRADLAALTPRAPRNPAAPAAADAPDDPQDRGRMASARAGSGQGISARGLSSRLRLSRAAARSRR